MVAVPESVLQQAEALLGFRKSDEAIDVLRSRQAPEDARACALLARAYYQRGDARGDMYASHFFACRAMELGVDDTRIVAIRAVAAFRRERYAEAAECFASYVTEASGPATQLMCGLSLARSGRPEHALAWITRALEAEPDSEEGRRALREARDAVGGKPAPARPGWTRAPQGLGGPADRRPEGVPAPYRSNALSMLRGHARAPKDFEWLAQNIPCQKACPAGTDIPAYLAAIYEGRYDDAYKINLHDNVFPAVLGRVCARPCEAACRHGWEGLGEPVAICFSKRSAADFKKQGLVVLDPWSPPSGKRVAVVGAGVAGLAAARNLALMGHKVTVYEKHGKPGGMMNQGIPEFRLPRDVIDREVEQVRRQGVEIVCNTAVGRDLPIETLLQANDAVVLAAGTLRPNLLNIPGHDLAGIRHGLDFLLEANEEGTVRMGEDIVVIGGGFTAMDCARTAKRLGAHTVELELETTEGGEAQILKLKGESIKVLYRRSQAEMLVTPGELEELGHEGIPMHFMVAPVAYVGEGGRVKAMRFARTELGEPDAGGRRRPVAIPGSEFEIPATTVLLATGQFPDTSMLDGSLTKDLVAPDGWLKSGRSQTTDHPKIFVAGDFATGARSLIDAIAHAKDCARRVDEFLMGERRFEDVALIEDATAAGRIREMDAVARQPMPAIDLSKRTLAAEVETGFTREGATEETQRCYLCHYKYEIDPDRCIYCDWCIKAKPRPECIVKVESLIYDESDRIVGFQKAAKTEETKLIWINQADCIRCNACVEACPVDAISVQRVSLCNIRKSDAAETVSLPSRIL